MNTTPGAGHLQKSLFYFATYERPNKLKGLSPTLLDKIQPTLDPREKGILHPYWKHLGVWVGKTTSWQNGGAPAR
jgi:hypothetical protein